MIQTEADLEDVHGVKGVRHSVITFFFLQQSFHDVKELETDVSIGFREAHFVVVVDLSVHCGEVVHCEISSDMEQSCSQSESFK